MTACNPSPFAASKSAIEGPSVSLVLQRLSLLALAPLLLLATGCASYLSADVTTFHQLSPSHRLAGQRFVIEPAAEQKDSLEFRAYADLVREALVREGLVAASGGDADLAVSIRYSLDAGRPVTYSYPAYGYTTFGPVWGWVPHPAPGGHIHYVWSAGYPLGYGVVGTTYSQSVRYRRELRVDISDRRPAGKGVKRFEGSVVSEGEVGALAPVMPAMVRALFSDFPGPHGVTRRVQVDLPPRQGQGAAAAPPASPATVPAPDDPPAGTAGSAVQ